MLLATFISCQINWPRCCVSDPQKVFLLCHRTCRAALFPNTESLQTKSCSSGGQNCLALHHPLVECVFYDFWSGATEVEASNNADMRANDVSGAYPLFKVGAVYLTN